MRAILTAEDGGAMTRDRHCRHFEGSDIVTRGFTGEIARWSLPSSPDLARTVDHLARCLPLRLDDDTGDLVEQAPSCDQ
jgi:hypothetical protein